MTHCNTGVLTSPFMRAALVIEIDPAAVTAAAIRPARFFSSGIGGRFSRLVPPVLSPTWVVAHPAPGRLRQALAARVIKSHYRNGSRLSTD